MAQHTESLCPLVLANPAGILIKTHVKPPMQSIFNTPMLPHRIAKSRPISTERDNIISPLQLYLFTDFTLRLHEPNTL